jgi:hypothetical protein
VAERERIAEFKEVAELMPDDPVVRFGSSRTTLPPIAGSSGHWSELDDARRCGLRTERGSRVAAATGDLQTKKEIEVFLRRLDSAGS